MSDSIGVMFAGKLFGPFPAKEMNVDRIGAMMTGTWKEVPQDEEP